MKNFVDRNHWAVLMSVFALTVMSCNSSTEPNGNPSRVPGVGSRFSLTLFRADTAERIQIDSVVIGERDTLGKQRVIGLVSNNEPNMVFFSYAHSPSLEIRLRDPWFTLPFNGSVTLPIILKDTTYDGKRYFNSIATAYAGDTTLTLMGRKMFCHRVRYDIIEQVGVEVDTDRRLMHFAPELGYIVYVIEEGSNRVWTLTEYLLK